MKTLILKNFTFRKSDYLFPLFPFLYDNKNPTLQKYGLAISPTILRTSEKFFFDISLITVHLIFEIGLLFLITTPLPLLFSVTLGTARIFKIWSFIFLIRSALLLLETATRPKHNALSISSIFCSLIPAELTFGIFTHEWGHALAYYLCYGNLPKQLVFDRIFPSSGYIATTEPYIFQPFTKTLPRPFQTKFKGPLAKVFTITPRTADRIFLLGGPILNIINALANIAIASKCNNFYAKYFFLNRASLISISEYAYSCSALRFDPKNHIATTDHQNLVKLGINRWLLILPTVLNLFAVAIRRALI